MEDVRADRGFLADLKRLDRRLDCVFKGTFFVITYDRGYGEPVNVYTVNEDGRFRYPAQIDIEHVAGGDLEKVSGKDRIQKAAYYAEEFARKQKKLARDNIRDMTKDSKYQLKRAFEKANEGIVPPRNGMPL